VIDNHSSNALIPTEITGRLVRDDGPALAYAMLPPSRRTAPIVMFLPGFRSRMDGLKALALKRAAQDNGWGCVRFDYSGHGASEGDPIAGTVGAWRADATAVLDHVTPPDGPVILVGSSMGGWIGLLLAADRPARVAGLLTVAAAADSTVDLMPGRMTDAQRQMLERDGIIFMPTKYGPDPYPISKALLEEGVRHRVLWGRDEADTDSPGSPRHQPLAEIACPVRMIHGLEDPDIPWRRSLDVLERLTGADARLTLVRDGDHRLSRPGDLDLILATLRDLVAVVEPIGDA
jgi:pimeloyl-ACP methyl ester carboxylesterase